MTLLASATTILGTVPAIAAPAQPGTTTDNEVGDSAPVQPGTTTEQGPAPSQPGTTTTPSPEPEPVQQTAPTWAPPEYQSAPTRQLPDWDYDSNTYQPAPTPAPAPAPLNVTEMHLPAPVDEPTAPIQAPRDTLRFGDVHIPQPNWVSDQVAADANGNSATAEAMVTDFWRSTGVDADRADRIAAAQVAGGAGGVVAGAAIAGIPAATVGGLIGGTIGGTSGAALAAPIVTPVGAVPAGVVGTAVGAGIGAAALGIPAGVVGGVIGGTAGVISGTVFGAGDKAEPETVELPDIDQDQITADTEQMLDDWRNNPPVGPAAADALQGGQAAIATAVEDSRDAVSDLPGGQDALDALDQVNADVAAATELIARPMDMVAEAIDTGIDPDPNAINDRYSTPDDVLDPDTNPVEEIFDHAQDVDAPVGQDDVGDPLAEFLDL